ncbi:hypothetical protein DVH24_019402 [Malus domestica]|uniref:Uncharacterized protein n=1 Tax=Malus domestica TaxID=3750 RepID=A0A498I2W7_MALDO|nr:hypothetical protein DVH24_019402 [Malus domestica]
MGIKKAESTQIILRNVYAILVNFCLNVERLDGGTSGIEVIFASSARKQYSHIYRQKAMLLGIGKHCYMLYLDRQQMWDYVGDAYAHRLNQAKVDGEVITGMDTRRIHRKGVAMHVNVVTTLGIGGARKVEIVSLDVVLLHIVNEYNRLLASQLETQRQYYESQLMKAKSTMESSVSKAVERALNSKMRVFSSETGEMSGGKNGVEDVSFYCNVLLFTSTVISSKTKPSTDN